MWTDTHAHLDDFIAVNDLTGLLERAAAAGVTRVLAVGGDPDANDRAIAAARAHPDRVAAAVGFDRALAGAPPPSAALRSLLSHPEVVAVGEIGLDYHYSADTGSAQRALLAAMLEEAAAAGKPVIVHSRAAEADTLAQLGAHARDPRVPAGRVGVVHCFTGEWPFARALLDLGFHLGISGIVTFRSAESIRDAIRRAPDDRLLLETDCPHLAPVPVRGRRNEPAFLHFTGEFAAALRGCDAAEFAHITRRNAGLLFGGGVNDE